MRNASYTKRFKFISPLAKTNDQPLKYIPKHPVSQKMIDKCSDLKQQIESEKKLHVQQEGRFELLAEYYEAIKGRKISDRQEF